MDNFDKLYPNYNAKLSDLLSLDDIPYRDKAWLASRVAPLKTLQQWSVECAEYVLENFEKKFPNDNRVRDCIEVTKKVINGELEESVARSAAESAVWSAASAAQSAAESAWSVARSAAESAVWSAVWSAASAAQSAAESAWSAAWSAAESAVQSAAESAWSAAESAAESAVQSAAESAWSAAESAEKEQEDINLSILIALLKNKGL